MEQCQKGRNKTDAEIAWRQSPSYPHKLQSYLVQVFIIYQLRNQYNTVLVSIQCWIYTLTSRTVASHFGSEQSIDHRCVSKLAAPTQILHFRNTRLQTRRFISLWVKNGFGSIPLFGEN